MQKKITFFTRSEHSAICNCRLLRKLLLSDYKCRRASVVADFQQGGMPPCYCRRASGLEFSLRYPRSNKLLIKL